MGPNFLRFLPTVFILLVAAEKAGAATHEQEMIEQVAARLLNVAEPIPAYDDRIVYSIQGTGVRASIVIRALNGRKRAAISLSPDLLERVVKGDRDVLAFVLGHQLAHLMLGHALPEEAPDGSIRQPKPLSSLEEEQAEWMSAELLVRAGFSLRRALRGISRFQEASPDAETFDGLAKRIGSWEDRLARFDREQIPIVKQMSAWQAGVVLLATEQYLLAEMCFERVTKEFPACADAWTGLGYAKLMRYFDGLTLTDLGETGFGMVMSRGFRRRAPGFEPPFRLKNMRLWIDAVESLQEGARQNPGDVRAQAALGLAFLFHPRGAQLERAREMLQAAAAQAEATRAVRRDERAEILFNLAIVLGAEGKHKDAQSTIERCASLYGDETMPLALRSALAYRGAWLMSTEKQADARSKSIDRWAQFLMEGDPTCTWWNLACLDYERLCQAEGREALDRSRLRQQANGRHRATAWQFDPAVDLLPGGNTDEAIRKLGRPRAATVARNTNLMRLTWKEGLDVLAAETIFVIQLAKENSPKLNVGKQLERKSLRIGMSLADAEQILGADFCDWTFMDSEYVFHFYPDRGLALRIVNDRIVEIMVVAV